MPENTDMIPVESNPLAPSIDFNVPKGYICTVDITTDQGAINAANALGAAESLSQYGKDEFTIVDIITKPGVRAVSEEACTDVILILDDGNCLFSQSVGILNSVIFMAASLGKEKIHRGVHVKLSEITTRGGNTMKQLKILGFAS